ncbi:MAG: FHA domain-containing protein [Verrucomicrobiales bacterium]|nr:FHA domain-containing protein [Verrucomicrobiales bacterium]
MELRLRIIMNEKGETTDLQLGKLTTIGRADSNRIQIQQSYISQRHARIIETDGGTFVIEDLESKNGTFVNDIPVDGTTEIADGDILRFGIAACSVVRPDSTSASPPPLVASASPKKLIVKGSRSRETYNQTFPSSYCTQRKITGRAKKDNKKVYLADKMKQRKRSGLKLYDPSSV